MFLNSIANMVKLLALFFLVASWLVPIHFLPWVSWHNEILVFLAVLLAAWVIAYPALMDKSTLVLEFPMSVLLFLAFAVLATLQFAFGLITFFGDALVISFYFSLSVICIILGWLSVTSTNKINKAAGREDDDLAAVDISYLAFGVLFGSFLSTIVALAQVLDLWEAATWIGRMPEARRPGGNLGQPNQLASLILMGFASLLFLFESKKLSAALALLILPVLTVGLAVTESRTGILSFYLLVLWFLLKRNVVGFRLPVWGVLSTLMSFSLLFFLWPMFFESIQMLGSGAAVNIQPGTRFIIWPQLIHAIMLKPWSGWGVGRVSDAQNAVSHDYPPSEAFTYSHNIFLDLVLGVGIPAAGFISVVIGIWLWRRIKLANQLAPWFCVAVSLPVAVHSMLEFPFAYSYFLAPVMFSLGVLDGMVGSRRSVRVAVVPVVASLIMVTTLMAWSVVEYVEVEEDFRVVRFEALRLGTKPENYERPTFVLLTQLDALLSGGRIVPKPGMPARELELAKKVALRYPWTATQNRYALSLALNGNTEEAIRQMRVIRSLHGESAYREIKLNWAALAAEKYPQLANIALPN